MEDIRFRIYRAQDGISVYLENQSMKVHTHVAFPNEAEALQVLLGLGAGAAELDRVRQQLNVHGSSVITIHTH